MSANFTKGPYLRRGRYVCGQRDGLQIWSAYIDPCKPAIETAELEAVAALFQASPLLYEALKECRKELEEFKRLAHGKQDFPPTKAMEMADTALSAARGEE